MKLFHFKKTLNLDKIYKRNDFINNENWIFGLLGQNIENDNKFKEKITNLFNLAYENKKINFNNLNFVTNSEAEMIKMFKNCFLATKVSFCNEMYEFCQLKNIDYENVRLLATADTRILPSHTYVPGHDGKKGFGGTCFPKDTNSLKYEMEQIGIKPYILTAIKKRNEIIDRPEKDWLNDKGRASI